MTSSWFAGLTLVKVAPDAAAFQSAPIRFLYEVVTVTGVSWREAARAGRHGPWTLDSIAARAEDPMQGLRACCSTAVSRW